jgi:hypothetical protein
MKYALVSKDDGTPYVLWVESKDGLKLYAPYEDAEEKALIMEQQEAMKKMGVTKAEEAIASGYSYYNVEIGEYSGEAKVKIDKIISEFD